MSEKTHTFKRDGAFVIAKPVKVVEEEKLTNKRVVELVHVNRANILEGEKSIKDSREAQERAEKGLAVARASLKELEEHYQWSYDLQVSRLKALCEEKHQEIFDKVNKTYNDDPTLTDEQNLRQKFMQYRGYMAMDPTIVEEIASDILKEKLYTKCQLVNPWL